MNKSLKAKKVAELRALEAKIRDIGEARAHGVQAAVEDRVREEQMQAKQALISKLQEGALNQFEEIKNIKHE